MRQIRSDSIWNRVNPFAHDRYDNILDSLIDGQIDEGNMFNLEDTVEEIDCFIEEYYATN